MGSEAVGCEQCGAIMVPGADGRTYACEYCRAQVLVTVDAAQIAAGMKLDLADATAFLDRLAEALETAVADRTKIRREGVRVVAIELDLDPDMFVAKREARGLVAQHKRMVRGIALKTATHPLDRWVEMLSAALATHANEHARTTEALAAFFGRR
ncbi:MAG: hypothetical protein ACHREM_02435 [Polyangiales bacterium]